MRGLSWNHLLPVMLCALVTAPAAQEVGDLRRGVAKVRVTPHQGHPRTGTSFVVHLDVGVAHLLTASHVVEGAREIRVEFLGRRRRELPAEVVGLEEGSHRGLAALRVAAELPRDLPSLTLDPYTPVYAGDPVAWIGFPSGAAPWSVSRGEVVGHRGKDLVFSGPVEEGSSGGPLIKNGRVVGVVTKRSSTFSFAAPAAIAAYVLEGWAVPDARREALMRTLAIESQRLRSLAFQPDESGERPRWPDLGKPKGRDDLAQLSILLAVESLLRAPSKAARSALRAALGMRPVQVVRIPDARVVAFEGGGRTLSVAGASSFRVWDLEGGETGRFGYGLKAATTAVSPDGRLVAAGTATGIVSVRGIADGREICSLEIDGALHSLGVSQDNRLLVTLVGPRTKKDVRVWDTASGSERWSRPADAYWDAFAIDRGGRYLALATPSDIVPGELWVGELDSGRTLWRRAFHDPVGSFGFSADGARLAVSTFQRTHVWSSEDGRERVRILDPMTGPASPAFSPDGRFLATATGRGIAVWDLSRADPSRMLPDDAMFRLARNSEVLELTFSPDSDFLAASTGHGGVGRLWDVSNGQEVMRTRHDRPVTDLTFSPDGAYLVSRAGGDVAKVWRLRPGDLVAEACARLDRNLTPAEWRTYVGSEPYRRTCNELP